MFPDEMPIVDMAISAEAAATLLFELSLHPDIEQPAQTLGDLRKMLRHCGDIHAEYREIEKIPGISRIEAGSVLMFVRGRPDNHQGL
jgi:hypothetical protein